MIPQEHTEAIWPEEQAPFHVEETPSWRTRSRLFWALGVIVPLVAGLPIAFLQTPDETSWNVFLLLVILVGIVSAALLRSWWAMLIVPVAFSVGLSLSQSFAYGFDKFVPGLLNYITLFFIVLVEIGVLIGTPLGKMIEQRLQQRATVI